MNIRPPHPFVGRSVIVIHPNLAKLEEVLFSAGIVAAVVKQGVLDDQGYTLINAHLFPAEQGPKFFPGIRLHSDYAGAVKHFAESKGASHAYFV